MTPSGHAGQAVLGSTTEKRRERIIGVICALFVVILFSSFNIFSRLGSSAGFAIWDLAALRFGIGGLFMLPFFLNYRISGLSMKQAIKIAFLGGLGFALFAYSGFFMAPAAHGAVLLHGTLPLFTFIVCLLLGEVVRRGAILGVLLIALGIGLMALDSMRGATFSQLIGDGCLLLASLFWSSCSILIKRSGISSVQAAAIVVVISACIYLPIYFIAFGAEALLTTDSLDLLFQGIFQGVLIGALSIFIYTRSVQSLGPTGTALFTAAIPCVTALAAIPILAEMPSMAEWVGVGVVTIGMAVAFTKRG